jgi:hypothetical protein
MKNYARKIRKGFLGLGGYDNSAAVRMSSARTAECEMYSRKIKKRRETLWKKAKEHEMNGDSLKAQKLIPFINRLDSQLDMLDERKQAYGTIEETAALEGTFESPEGRDMDVALSDYATFKAEEIKERGIYGEDMVAKLSGVEAKLLGTQEEFEEIHNKRDGYEPGTEKIEESYRKLKAEVETEKGAQRNNVAQLEQALQNQQN